MIIIRVKCGNIQGIYRNNANFLLPSYVDFSSLSFRTFRVNARVNMCLEIQCKFSEVYVHGRNLFTLYLRVFGIQYVRKEFLVTCPQFHLLKVY